MARKHVASIRPYDGCIVELYNIDDGDSYSLMLHVESEEVEIDADGLDCLIVALKSLHKLKTEFAKLPDSVGALPMKVHRLSK